MLSPTNSGRRSRTLSGIGIDYIGMVAISIAGFLITPYILRFISPENFGFWTTTSQFVSLLGLLDFSLGLGVMKLASKLENRRQPNLNRLLTTSVITFLGLSAAMLLLGYALCPYMMKWFHIEAAHMIEVKTVYFYTLFWAAISLFLSLFSSFLIGNQYLSLMTTINIISALSTSVFTVLLLYCGVGLMALPVANIIAAIGSGLVVLFFFFKLLPSPAVSLKFWDLKIFKQLWLCGGSVQLGKIANTLTVSTDSIIIASILGPSAVAVYALTSRLPLLISSTIASKIGSALSPAIAELYAEGEWATLKRAYQQVCYIITRFSLFWVVCLGLILEPFVSLWVGKVFFGGLLLTLVMLIWVIQNSFISATASFVWLADNNKGFAIFSGIESVVNLTATFILVRSMGMVGAALGTVIAKSVTMFVYLPYQSCKTFSLSFKDFFLVSIGASAFKSIPTIAVGGIVYFFFPVTHHWISIVGASAVLGITNILSFEGWSIYQRGAASPLAIFKNLRRLEYTLLQLPVEKRTL